MLYESTVKPLPASSIIILSAQTLGTRPAGPTQVVPSSSQLPTRPSCCLMKPIKGELADQVVLLPILSYRQ
jgi:hypothetical protein